LIGRPAVVPVRHPAKGITMRELGRGRTLTRAALGAVVSTLSGYPRLATWTDRDDALGFLVVMLGLSSFVLWAFVVAWLPGSEGRSTLSLPRRWSDWVEAAGWGVVCGWGIAWCVDPVLRRITPQDYPGTGREWVVGTLFTLGFVQLFLCYAPYALLHRLTGRSPTAAAAGTVVFGLFVFGLQLRATLVPVGSLVVWVLVAVRIGSSLIAIRLLRTGGPGLVTIWALIIQLRLLGAFLDR